MVQLLHHYGADMLIADQDGTAPIHFATAGNHLDVLRFLHEQGVSMETKGMIFLDDSFKTALVHVTPLEIAQHYKYDDIVRYLQPPSAIDQPAPKRQRSELSIIERATRVGVADRLKVISSALEETIRNGSPDECAAARKEKQKIQIANQKIVARAEQKRE